MCSLRLFNDSLDTCRSSAVWVTQNLPLVSPFLISTFLILFCSHKNRSCLEQQFSTRFYSFLWRTERRISHGMAWWQEILWVPAILLDLHILFSLLPSFPLSLLSFLPLALPYSLHFLLFSLFLCFLPFFWLTRNWSLVWSFPFLFLLFLGDEWKKSAVGISVYTLSLSNLPGQE